MVTRNVSIVGPEEGNFIGTVVLAPPALHSTRWLVDLINIMESTNRVSCRGINLDVSL